MQPVTVIFDLDGTLADTSGDLIAAANHCFEGLGLGPLLNVAEDAGTALRGGRAMLNLGFSRVSGFGPDEVERQYPVLLEAYARNIDHHTVLYPGAMLAVETLKQQGHLVGICTNKPEALARDLLNRLGILNAFASLIGADTLPVRKPDPEPLRQAVTQAGGDPLRCCLVGDSDTDRNTARAAGVPSVLVTFGPSGDDMAALEPEALLSDYSQLPDVIARLFGADA